jgi:glyoxylase-like metal-dependent hydrolase (beta-lactamase superfamily II)
MKKLNLTPISRRSFLGGAAAYLTAASFASYSRPLFAQRAGVTAAQMRAAGTTAKIKTLPLRNGLSVLMGSGGNIVVLPGRDGKLSIDSGFATSQTQMAAALEALSAEPLRHLINTHWHYDHTDGNEWMHGAGATIVAHEKTLGRMSSSQEIPAFDAMLPPSPAGALPTVVFATTHTMELNGEKIRLERYTPAHTDTDISVFLSGANVLHTGDTWFNGYYPFIDYNSGGNINGLLAAAAENLKLTDAQTMVVPGHGAVGDRSSLLAFQEMLTAIRDQVAALKQSGASLEAVIAAKPTAKFDEKWGGGFITPNLFTRLVYRGV